jgi:hypothetical protein
MIPGLQLPPKGPGPRISWLSSLRPNARSLRPAEEQEAAAPARAPRVRRWHLALGCALACALLVGAAVWGSRSHHRAKIVQSVVSGRAGLRKTASGAVEHWSSSTLTVTIDPSLAGATPQAKAAIMDAFGTWASSDALLPRVTFNATDTPGAAAQDGVNRLLLGPITVAGQEQDLAITISYADTDTGAVVEADTIFNSAYDWASIGATGTGDSKDSDGRHNAHKGSDSKACEGRYDLQNVATHEAGHFFGLGEDFDDPSTTMYVSSTPCQTSKRALSTTDVTVISGLYSQPLASPPQNAACAARIAGRREHSGMPLVAMGLVALVWSRRRRRVSRS